MKPAHRARVWPGRARVVAWLRSLPGDLESEFALLDLNGDGQLSRRELVSATGLPESTVDSREKQIGGSGGSLEPPGPLS